ncbi:hypothetical protein [Deinococcus wulumuqiensis]|uniref:hypothetical protein n=1 Tax=Deinococcus wulumuqiensis TaxID=980427 RepID=UPI00298FF425|nr:hypothetical protein [Deinococcus wulumuqiensis]
MTQPAPPAPPARPAWTRAVPPLLAAALVGVWAGRCCGPQTRRRAGRWWARRRPRSGSPVWTGNRWRWPTTGAARWC